jgi:hypothetical protein
MSYLQRAKEWVIENGYRSKEADPYKTLFDKAAAELNKDYPANVLTFIKKNHNKLNDAINTSERKLDQLWGKAPVDEFREELKTFYKLNLKAVKLYREGHV